MYGQDDDQVVDEGQEVIKYIHFGEDIFRNDNLSKSANDERRSD